MPFFHAEPLFEQKHAVLEQKKHLLEAEKLHNTYMTVQFQALAHAHPTGNRQQKLVFPLLFCNFRL